MDIANNLSDIRNIYSYNLQNEISCGLLCHEIFFFICVMVELYDI